MNREGQPPFPLLNRKRRKKKKKEERIERY
jgi:hypothetical protein